MTPPDHAGWDQQQREVIDAPAETRLLINAGPGTGKTAVACARVSQLIDQEDLEPGKIWLISFTRTAVREIQDRIASYLGDNRAAYAVKVATLDSHAWTIHSGFDENAKILDSYEENINHTLDLVQRNEDVAEEIKGIEHLVVDEAQDIIDTRADLVIAIIRKLHPSCGVTVFADEAQAIYDFTREDEIQTEEVARKPLLSESIRNGTAGTFKEYELTQVHRTSSEELLKIFTQTRRKVLVAEDKIEDKFGEVKDEIIRLAHGGIRPANEIKKLAGLGDDTLILHRRRCDVLLTSSLLTKKGVRHRVRMSGLPVCLAPWIGVALSEHVRPNLSRDRFMELWDEKVSGTFMDVCMADEAWAQLVRIAGRSKIVLEMKRLRECLGRQQPPIELCHTELGLGGPIVGTIHAFKGREADAVCLMLPRESPQDAGQDEETRVMFVGATRGRKKLLVGSGYRLYFSKRVEGSGRAYRLDKKRRPSAQIEIGCDTDITIEGLAGRCFFESPDVVRASQTRLQSFANKTVSLVAKGDVDVDYSYRLRLKKDDQDQCLAVLSQTVNQDLFKVAKAIQKEFGGERRRLPGRIKHLYVHGLRTIVLPPNAQESEMLHDPWRSTGIILAPVVWGYSMEYFPSSRKKGRK